MQVFANPAGWRCSAARNPTSAGHIGITGAQGLRGQAAAQALLTSWSSAPGVPSVQPSAWRGAVWARPAVAAAASTTSTAKAGSAQVAIGTKTLVRISVPFRVNFGEVIKVVGSGRSLGEWDVLKAPRFEWTDGDIWVGNLLMDAGQEDFKVVVFNERTKEARWESSSNRLLKVPDGPGTLTVSCYWNQPSTSGWFVGGKVDLTNVKLSTSDPSPSSLSSLAPASKPSGSSSSSASKSGRERSGSPEPSVLLSHGFDAMLKRSGSPEPARGPSSSSSSSASGSSSSGSSSKAAAGWAKLTTSGSASAKASRWRSAVMADGDGDEEHSDEEEDRHHRHPTSSSSSSSSSGSKATLESMKERLMSTLTAAASASGSSSSKDKDKASSSGSSSSSSGSSSKPLSSSSSSRQFSAIRTPAPTPPPSRSSSSSSGSGGSSSKRSSRYYDQDDDEEDEWLERKYRESRRSSSSSRGSGGGDRDRGGREARGGDGWDFDWLSQRRGRSSGGGRGGDDEEEDMGSRVMRDARRGGEALARNLSNLSNVLGAARGGGSGGSGKGGRRASSPVMRQLESIDGAAVFKQVRDAVNALANSEQTIAALKQQRRERTPRASRSGKDVDGSHHADAGGDDDAVVWPAGERLLRAVSSVVSTKSPSALRGEAVDEQALKDAYRRKPPLPADVDARRPSLKEGASSSSAAGKSSSAKRWAEDVERSGGGRRSGASEQRSGGGGSGSGLEALAQAMDKYWAAVRRGADEDDDGNGKKKKKENPKIKLEVELPVNEARDPAVLGGVAVVTAAVLAILNTDQYSVRQNLSTRTEAIRTALVEPLPNKKTPQPARGGAPASAKPAANKSSGGGAASSKPVAASAKPAGGAAAGNKPSA